MEEAGKGRWERPVVVGRRLMAKVSGAAGQTGLG